MFKKLRQIMKPAAMLALMMSLVIAGCADFENNPFGPDTAGITTENDSGVLTKRGGKNAKITDSATSSTESAVSTADAPDYVKSKMIRAKRGGMIALNTENFFYTVNIPRNALDRDTEITITIPDDSKSMFIMEPHGIQFNVPVEVVIDAKVNGVAFLDPSDAPDDAFDVYYYNEESQSWEAQGGSVTLEEHNNWITARVQLHHFSRYGLGGDAPSYMMIQKYYYMGGIVHY